MGADDYREQINVAWNATLDGRYAESLRIHDAIIAHGLQDI